MSTYGKMLARREELERRFSGELLDGKYKEILKLDKMLNEAGIPHTLDRMMDGWQIVYFKKGTNIIVMYAIEFFGSYGNREDLLEIMGLLTPEEEEHDSVLGHLTAEEVFGRIKKHWEEQENG